MRASGFLIFVLLIGPLWASGAAAQDRVGTARQAVVAPARATTAAAGKTMPDVTMANICDRAKARARSGGHTLTIACVPGGTQDRLTAKADVQASDVTCKYTENDEGGFDAKSCKCSKDEDSDCTGFITWCAKQGGDVSGNNQSATCD